MTVRKIQEFLDEGNDVNAYDRRFAEQQADTPLIWAVIKMSPKGVELLLENGADPNLAVRAYFRGAGSVPKYSGGNALTWAAGYTGVGVTIAISRRVSWYGTMDDYRMNRMSPKRLKIIKLLNFKCKHIPVAFETVPWFSEKLLSEKNNQTRTMI